MPAAGSRTQKKYQSHDRNADHYYSEELPSSASPFTIATRIPCSPCEPNLLVQFRFTLRMFHVEITASVLLDLKNSPASLYQRASRVATAIVTAIVNKISSILRTIGSLAGVTIATADFTTGGPACVVGTMSTSLAPLLRTGVRAQQRSVQESSPQPRSTH